MNKIVYLGNMAEYIVYSIWEKRLIYHQKKFILKTNVAYKAKSLTGSNQLELKKKILLN